MYIDFDKMPFMYWTKEMLISWLQRFILIHCIIYYEFNDNVISDSKFDDKCRNLVHLQTEFYTDFEKSQYYYCFYDFTGETGYYLFNRLRPYDSKRLTSIAWNVLSEYNKSITGENKAL